MLLRDKVAVIHGAAALGAASAIAAFSRSVEMLIAMRALLGIVGATLAPFEIVRRSDT